MKKIKDLIFLPLVLTLVLDYLFVDHVDIPVVSFFVRYSDLIIFVYAIGYAAYALRDFVRTDTVYSTGIAKAIILLSGISFFGKEKNLDSTLLLIMSIVVAIEGVCDFNKKKPGCN